MNKRQVYIVLTLSIFFLRFELTGQVNKQFQHTFYGELTSNSTPKLEDYNLKGKVKFLKEISANDSTFFNFNVNGLLEKRFNSSSAELTLYKFKNDLLKSIHFEKPESKYVSNKYFDTLGYIQKEVIESIINSDTYLEELNYVFNEKYDELNISYNYNFDNPGNLLNQFCSFAFNNKNQVIKERFLYKNKETTHGSTNTYFYDSLNGNLINITYIADCAMTVSSNSCRNHLVSFEYDKNNNIVSESLTDFTVRNANWSDSYSYSFKYNENNDIIEEKYSREGDINNGFEKLFFDPQKNGNREDFVKVSKPLFEYEYDLNGNWIKKYESVNKTRKLISSRIIEYYN